MAKMHELLAAESTVAGNYNTILGETEHVFGQPKSFLKEIAAKTYFDAADKHLDTSTEDAMKTTVNDRLNWFGKSFTKFMDIQIQKDKTNQSAKADIVLDDGSTIYKDVPATTLLMMETKLSDVRKVFEKIPTLDAGTKWEFNSAERLWETHPAPTFTTKKTFVPLVLAQATDKHPAQVKEGYEDKPVAKVEKTIFSGMITSGAKADLLGRLDALIAAVKKARQRANATDVAEAKKFGEAVFGYIYGDLKAGA